jgi:hypothetical protein
VNLNGTELGAVVRYSENGNELLDFKELAVSSPSGVLSVHEEFPSMYIT